MGVANDLAFIQCNARERSQNLEVSSFIRELFFHDEKSDKSDQRVGCSLYRVLLFMCGYNMKFVDRPLRYRFPSHSH